MNKLVCLAGGVGAAKFLQGLVRVLPPDNITAIVNTGDDIESYGLRISPDPDIITYTLAGLVDEEKGWGIKGDTFNCLDMLQRYGLETWFRLGDKDLATHIYRTELLREGLSLSKVAQKLCTLLGVKTRILPVTDDTIGSFITTDKGTMHFEEYLVKWKSLPKVLGVHFEGTKSARPAPNVLKSIREADGIIVCPSNPIVSIGPILAVKGVREELVETNACVVAVSPIVGGSTIKGPADKLMSALGLEVSSSSVALLYCDFLDTLIIDKTDASEEESISKLGVRVIIANTVMRSLQEKVKLAKLAVDATQVSR